MYFARNYSPRQYFCQSDYKSTVCLSKTLDNCQLARSISRADYPLKYLFGKSIEKGIFPSNDQLSHSHPRL